MARIVLAGLYDVMDPVTFNLKRGFTGPVGPVSSMTLFYSAASDTTGTGNLSLPAYSNPGEFAVYFQRVENTTFSVPAAGSPTGWTQCATGGSSDSRVVNGGTRHVISAKVLESGDPGSTIVGMADGDRANWKMLLLFGFFDNPINSITPGGAASLFTSRSASITIVGSSPPALYVYFMTGYASHTIAEPAGWTEENTMTNGSSAYCFFPEPTSISDQTLTVTSTSGGLGCYITFG